MKIAIVHDWLYGGGAERVVEELHHLYPDAPIYTTFATNEWRKKLDGKVITGVLGKWPLSKLYKFLPLFQQWWFAHLDLSAYDVVLSSCGNGAARFVGAKKPAKHISYTHTPTHYYWRKHDEYLKNPSFRPKWLVRIGLRVLVGYLRTQDYRAAQTVDILVANSTHIAADIQNFYDKPSIVVHPPVDVRRFETVKRLTAPGDAPRYVLWSRHVPYKRFDLAILACNELGADLTVIGTGPETEFLKSIAGATITFLGRASDERLERAASEASAFLFPGEEDFGIAPVEAMAAGLPVIAYRSGGALDYVVDGKTGVFFEQQTVKDLVGAIKKFEQMRFNDRSIREKAAEFGIDNFKAKMKKIVDDTAVQS